MRPLSVTRLLAWSSATRALGAAPRRSWFAFSMVLVAGAGCDGVIDTTTPSPQHHVTPAPSPPTPTTPPPTCTPVVAQHSDAGSTLSASRLLRRAHLLLVGEPPSPAQVEAVLAAEANDGGHALVNEAVEQLLSDPRFYDELYDFGREWLLLPAMAGIGDEPGYRMASQRNLIKCPVGTRHEGGWAEVATVLNDAGVVVNYPCEGFERDGTPALEKLVEPWWAPGTQVSVIGRMGNDAQSITVGTKLYDCSRLSEGELDRVPSACGCGRNLRYCRPSTSTGWANWYVYMKESPAAQRRLLWEEPARLVAHVGWFDKPMSDLIQGDYSVGPVEVQVAYVAAGRRAGALELDDDDSWWRPNQWTGLVDPRHLPTDPWAWREFQVPARYPFLLADRNYRFDPRTAARGSLKGIPAAGIFTMLGVLEGYPRERLRASRMLEAMACDEFTPPPSSLQFTAYNGDPAVSGPCQHCHTRIDPAAIHFKRWSYFFVTESHGPVGAGRLKVPDAWTQGRYPYAGGPYVHWIQWWKPNTVMTPVTTAEAEANPETRFIDFMPRGVTLYGQEGDGTVGPLGLAKLLVSSGAFDRCMVRRLHERFLGRTLDPANESAAIDALAKQFVAHDRKVRPFLKTLFQSETVRRGF